MKYHVYILKSLKDKKFYIGCTSDLNKRLIQHNSGKTPSLKHRRPLEIIYSESYSSRAEAFQREKEIKSYKSSFLFKKLINGGVA